MQGICYLEREEINEAKWDACINSSDNKNIYGYVQYLDAMADHWGAIIFNDYQIVLPIPWKKKWGIHYLYTPRFTSPLAIYGRNPDSISPNLFLDNIPHKFRLWDLNLMNDLSAISYSAIKRKNYVLDLSLPYDQLFKKYRSSYRNLIKQTSESKNHLNKNLTIDTVIELVTNKKTIKGTDSSDYDRLKKIYGLLGKEGKSSCYGIYSKDQDLMAAAVFFFSDNRIYYMLAWNNEDGRKAGASHQLIDAVIREYAGKDYLLDFEGSDIPGIAFFFEGFDATMEYYYFLRENRLPWWCRWMKK